MSTRLPMVFFALGLAACVGNIGDGLSDRSDLGGATPEETFGAPSDVRRLALAEYVSTLRALFGDGAVDAVLVSLQNVPDDRGKHEFSTMERGVSATHVDGYYVVAKALASVVANDTSHRAALDPCLGEVEPTDACVTTALPKLLLNAFRRPPTTTELEGLAAVHLEGKAELGTFAEGFALLLQAVLQSPHFLYRMELGAEPVEGRPDTYQLAPYELAARLSFFLAGTTPDAELYDRAETGAILDEVELERQVDRLLATPAAAQHVQQFFSEWLGVDRMPAPQHSDEFLDGIDAATYAAEAREELIRLVDRHVFAERGNWSTMMSTQWGHGSTTLQSVYESGAPDATGALALNPATRGGLLTRAVFLATASEQTHPILRGAAVLRRFLCDDIPLPEPSEDLVIEAPPYDASKTARERWTAQTSSPSCSSCHSRINPFGFALEKYDALGRFREMEPIVDPASGEVANQLPIDARVELEIDGELVEIDGAVELSSAIGDTDAAQACLAKKWFRFVHGRREAADDASDLESLEALAVDRNAVLSILRQVALQPSFRLRRTQ